MENKGIPYWCLRPVKQSVDLGSKCNHVPGQWVVYGKYIMSPKFWFIDPPTQLQKDIWLDSAMERGVKNPEKYLKWLCHTCGTVQEP